MYGFNTTLKLSFDEAVERVMAAHKALQAEPDIGLLLPCTSC